MGADHSRAEDSDRDWPRERGHPGTQAYIQEAACVLVEPEVWKKRSEIDAPGYRDHPHQCAAGALDWGRKA